MTGIRDLVVIGGGAGGLVVASVAAQLGLEVTLIEKNERLGGDCLHAGCVPSKTLIRVAKVVSLMRRGAEFGLPATDPRVDLGRINDHVQSVIDHIQVQDDPQRFRDYGCEVLFGRARFADPYTVEVSGRTIRGRRFVIATGSVPALPSIEGLESSTCLTTEDLFSLRELPQRLLVLGGGAIGLEMAQAFARLGSHVTVVETLPRLLSQEDPELADALQEVLEAEGLTVHTATRLERVASQDGAYRLRRREGPALEADRILAATGRHPAVEGLGLKAAGVDYNHRGIVVDRRMRSSQRHIYACGDVCGPYPFTHMAEYQAGIVLSNVAFHFPKRADYRVVPWVTYTDPELARVGLTEGQAQEAGLEPTVLRFPFRDIDRALTDSEPRGLAKYVVHRGKILGASILGPHAGELIHEVALAMKTGAGIAQLSATIHAYPTLAQIHRRTVNTWYGQRLFSERTRRIVRWLNRILP